MSRLMEKAVDLVNQIHACMRNVETCSAIAETIKDLPFVFKDNDKIISLDGVLTPEQMEQVKEVILNKIDENQMDAEKFLMALTGEEPKEEPVADVKLDSKQMAAVVKKAVKEEPKQSKAEKREPVKAEPKKVEVTPEDVKRLYLDENKTLDEVAKILGTNRSAVYKVVNNYGLRKPSKKDACFRDSK